MDKKTTRLRRAKRGRIHIREQGAVRLCVHRTPRHIYAQVISPEGSQIMASASTLDGDVRKELSDGNAVFTADQ
jgi:large subunit ribosomal protein L18